MDSSAANNFRTAILNEPNVIPPISSNGMSYNTPGNFDGSLRTPYAGVVRTVPPPLPQAPNQFGGYSGIGLGSYGGSGFGSSYGGYGSYGGGYGGFGGVGYGGLGNSYGYGGGYGYNRFGGGMNPLDPEARFIQLAEASSRPAFASIESLVMAIGNIASMLDSTFFALTSSFRAILGVAANFGRLRGVFAQFWHTFAILRGLNWIYRKFLYWLRLSKIDPSSESFKKAFAEALNETSVQSGAPQLPRNGQSPWPVLAFLSFIFTAPYLIMKLLGSITNTAQEEAHNPSKWIQPIETVAVYDFHARNSSELSLKANSRVQIAPKEIQNTLGLLNTGWALATTDGKNTGIIPINYVKSPQTMRQENVQQSQLKTTPQEQLSQQISNVSPIPKAIQNNSASIEKLDLSSSEFPAPPRLIQEIFEENFLPETFVHDFDIAHQPMGPPSTMDVAFHNDLCS